ncbi:undecaprenyl-diphosphatase [Catenuloplanes nepalensis]|uniref:Undecaprenyl-diphosphatase n=1 Tax=Catenuloplanes nepalensis TaxID=587533 RepID=A0ABT9MVY9_9ACTN|nr:phosphatase PAP2 family protein [Catenuloplanes nepalensis]MDP9795612.1 undecaprenyl-diphosphatase [Catenuloplanes nepalensis]
MDVKTWWARRIDRHDWLGLRLTLAAVAAALILIPFSMTAMLVVSRWAPLRTLDERVADALYTFARARPGWVDAVQTWTDVFSPTPLRATVVLLAAVLWWRGAHRVALWAVATIAAGGVLGLLLKILFGRSRPEFLDPVSSAPGYSFPSGHSMTAALASAVLLLMLLPLTDRLPHRRLIRAAMWAAALAVAIGTGLSRVALGVHWMSDVLGGWTLGIAVVVATTAAFETWRGAAHRPVTEGLREAEPAAR